MRPGLSLLITTLVFSFVPAAPVRAQIDLPLPSQVSLSPPFTPAIVRGMTIDPNNPFAFDFLVDPGSEPIELPAQKAAFAQLANHFLAALTIPEHKQWVNLSPYEGQRVIDEDFGKTEMGRDLLAQDYILKQISAALSHPKEKIGQDFWKQVYAQAGPFKNRPIPVHALNKVWIVPSKASIFEKGHSVYIIDSHLKVMMEEDYLAQQQNALGSSHEGSTEAYRRLILPLLEREVNEGKNFALLRQMYHGMILATWYKKALKHSILSQVYANRAKVRGIDLTDAMQERDRIYQSYLKAFKMGAYNLIKEEPDPATGQSTPRKYFSGGFTRGPDAAQLTRVYEWGDVQRAWRRMRPAAFLSVSIVLNAQSNHGIVPKVPTPSVVSRSAIDDVMVRLRRGESLISFPINEQNRAPLRIHVISVTSDLVTRMSGLERSILIELLRKRRILPKDLEKAAEVTGILLDKKNEGVPVQNPEIHDTLVEANNKGYASHLFAMTTFIGPRNQLVVVLAGPAILSSKQEKSATESSRAMLSMERLKNLVAEGVGHFEHVKNTVVRHQRLLLLALSLAQLYGHQIYLENEVVRAARQAMEQMTLEQGNVQFSKMVRGVEQDIFLLRLSHDLPTQLSYEARQRLLALVMNQYALGDGLAILKSQVPKSAQESNTAVEGILTDPAKDPFVYVFQREPGSPAYILVSVPSEETTAQTADKAQFAKGGIDFNDARMTFEVRRDGNGVPLPLASQDPAMVNAAGFAPMVVDIKPAAVMSLMDQP